MQTEQEKVKKKKAVVFDLEKFIIGIDHAHYSIDYDLFHADVDTTEMTVDEVRKLCPKYVSRTGQACFASFGRAYDAYTESDKKKPNRIRFFCDFKKHTNKKVHVNVKEIEEWMYLCKKHKFMPDNVDKNFVTNGIYDIRIDNISLNRVYLYLCFARYLQEEPYLVKGVLYLMKEHKIGFLTAFGVSSKLQSVNAGHHVIPVTRDYSLCYDNNKANECDVFDLVKIAQLYNYAIKKDKEKSLKDITEKMYLKSFNLHFIISKTWTSEYGQKCIHNIFINKKQLPARKTEQFLKSKAIEK